MTDSTSPPSAPAPTPPASPSPKEPFRLKAWHVIVPLIPVILFILNHINCNGVLKSIGIGPGKATAGPGEVIISPNKIVFTPAATKANPNPKASVIPKAPDDKVETKPNAAGGTDIKIDRLDLILEPTFGILWNGSLDLSSGADKVFEPSFGLRLAKFSRLGIGPMVTPDRFGIQLDYRIGNVTGALGGAYPFDVIKNHAGLVLSVNAIPFN